jgi:hypothetical protein
MTVRIFTWQNFQSIANRNLYNMRILWLDPLRYMG